MDTIGEAGHWVYLNGEYIYMLDSEDRLQPLPLRVITERQYKRLRYLEESYRKEKV